MPTGLTLDVSGDFLIFDNEEASCTFNQMNDNQTVANAITGVVGFGNREVFGSVEGLTQITKNWKIRASDIPTVPRVKCLDQLIDSSGATWIITNASRILYNFGAGGQWDIDSLRQDCLITICGTTADLYQGVSTQDAAGGYTWVLGNAPLYSAVPIRIVEQSSHIVEQDEQNVMVNQLKVWTLQTGIQLGQALVIAGFYYRVMGARPVLNRAIGSPIWYEVDCEEKQVMR